MSDQSQRLHTFFVVKEPDQADRIVVWDTQDITVGRSAENDLVIEHAEISRRQAVFARLNTAYVIKNHSTSNPTYVNDQAIQTAELTSKDRIRLAETELVFYQVAKNPATLGAKVEYASQLKTFGGANASAAGSPDSTMLGMMEMGGGDADDDEFEVLPAGEFDYDLHDVESGLEAGLGAAPKARNLDLEIDDPVLSGSAAPSPPAPRPAGDAFSVHLEIEGLTPEQQRFVEGLLGKVVALPALRIRLKGDDLG